MHLFRDLQLREKDGNPIRVGVVGAGFFGSGVIRQLVRTAGVRPVIIANRTPEKAAEALKRSGVNPSDIRLAGDVRSAAKAIGEGRYVVTGNLELPYELKDSEVITETTGNLHIGAEAALKAIESGKHFVGANPEAQATVGAVLRMKADQHSVVYSDMDGDQPGILQKLYAYVQGIGFRPLVAGNCKGVMKRWATPETQAAYCRENHIKPWIATAAADGTKLNIEMCLVANANGMVPAQAGMSGLQTSMETLLEDFRKSGLLEKGPIVEYTLGIPVGVFIIGYSEDPWVAEEMQYFKMGHGPHYLFFSPHVLCQYDAVPSIAEAALYRSAVITPLAGPQRTEVVTYAKTELTKDKRLDGIGGFDCYGQIVSREEYQARNMLPVGLAEYARLKRNIAKDEPVLMSDVDIEETNIITQLREEQERLLQVPASPQLQPSALGAAG